MEGGTEGGTLCIKLVGLAPYSHQNLLSSPCGGNYTVAHPLHYIEHFARGSGLEYFCTALELQAISSFLWNADCYPRAGERPV